MAEWEEHKLSDVAEVMGGFAFKSSEFGLIGLPIVKIKDIVPPNVVIEGCERVDVSAYDYARLAKYRLKKGDYLVAMTGATIGKVGRIRKEFDGYLNQRVARIRAKPELADNDFIYSCIRQEDFQDFVINVASGSSVQENASATDIGNFELLVPPLSEQRAIASIFSSLDDKIDLLHRQNKTLEALAETLFRQWFVEEAEKGWERCKLSSIAEHRKDSINPMKEPEKLFQHYSIPAFDDRREPLFELGKQIKSNKYKVVSNTLLISKLNPRTPRVWAIYGSVDETNSICSTEFQVVRPKRQDHFGFIYCYLKSFDVTSELANAVGGTSGSHQRVDPQVIFDLTVHYPPVSRVIEFDNATTHFWTRIGDNKSQIHTLAQLRDTLLPRLMSGEVRVKDKYLNVDQRD